MARLPPARNWCFTHHDPEALLDFSNCPSVVYAVYQEEVSPDTGRLHYQGYVHLRGPQRPSALYPCGLSKRTHFEKCKGTADQNYDYCTKEDSRVGGPYEYGERPTGGQGSRTDVAGFVAAIKRGATDRGLIDEHPMEFIKYYRAADRIRLALMPDRSTFEGVYVFYGETGTGKSYAAMQFDPEDTFVKQPSSDWWDGYRGQKTILLDEFRGWLTYASLLRLCDRYPLEVQNKGGQIKCAATRVIITTNKKPTEWYGEKIDIAPFLRRVRMVYYAKGLGKFLCLRNFDEDMFPEMNTWNGKQAGKVEFEEWDSVNNTAVDCIKYPMYLSFDII